MQRHVFVTATYKVFLDQDDIDSEQEAGKTEEEAVRTLAMDAIPLIDSAKLEDIEVLFPTFT